MGQHTERNRIWRRANPGKVAARNRRAYAVRAAKLEAIKRRPCFVCSETHPPFIMEFHHMETKTINISAKHGWSTLLAELAKCIVVCANCHAMLDYQKAQVAA